MIGQKQYTFFSIKPEKGFTARKWADIYWEIYGFDFDTEQTKDHVIAWPIDGDDEESIQALKDALDEELIEYTTFLVDDLDTFFGL